VERGTGCAQSLSRNDFLWGSLMTTRQSESGTMIGGNETLISSAYSYYGGVVKATSRPATAGGVKRLVAAALLSGASIIAVGAMGTGSARAGSCSEINSTVICTGSFNDAIYQDSVEDLTVVLGSGASIDTTGQTSAHDMDNAGLLIVGDGDLDVRNYGSIATGDNPYYDGEHHEWVYGGYLHHGISLFSQSGSTYVLNSDQGTVVTNAQASHGILAATASDEYEGGTSSVVNEGWIATKGDWSYGISAVSGNGADVWNEAHILTAGEHATGIYAGGGYHAFVTNNGSVETTGNEAAGIIVVAGGYSSTAIVINEGTISTSGKESDGISASVQDGWGMIVNSGTITTEGKKSAGIGADGETINVVNHGVIVTGGKSGHGVDISGDTVTLENTGLILAYGKNAHGVVARSDAPATTIIDNSGIIAAEGNGGAGIVASGPSVQIHNQRIEGYYSDTFGLVYSRWSDAIRVDHAFEASLHNEGYIHGNVDIDADEYAYVLNEKLITSHRKKTAALSVDVESGRAVVINDGTIITGENSWKHGMRSHGIEVFAAEEAVVLNSGTVETSGKKAKGIIVSTESGLAVGLNSGTIETSGDRADGLVVTAGSDTYTIYAPEEVLIHRDGHAVAGNIGLIETHGDDAVGVMAMAEGGNAIAFNLLGGTVRTEGEDSHGVVAMTGLGDDSPHEDEGGIAVALNGAPLGLVSHFSEVFHGGNYDSLSDVFGFLEDHLPEGEPDSPGAFRSTIVTTGDDAVGVAAVAARGLAIAANIYGEVTTGLTDNYGDVYSGTEAHGVVASASGSAIAFAVSALGSQVTTQGAGAAGVAAFSEAGSAYAGNSYSSSIVTHGDEATGLLASADGYYDCEVESWIGGYAFAGNIGANITTYGDWAVGIGAFSNADASVGNITLFADEEDEDGEDLVASVVTYGHNAHGVEVRAFDGTATLVNSGLIITHGDDAHGARIDGDTAILENSGTIQTYGEDAHAVVISSGSPLTTIVENSGTIQASGDDADALRASGPVVEITNMEDGLIASEDGVAIYASAAEYASIVNHGEITGDVKVMVDGEYGYAGETYVLNTGVITGNLDTSLGYSDDTIVIDGGTVTGAVHTGDGHDDVLVSGEGVVLGKGIHATAGEIQIFAPPPADAFAALTFAHDDEIILDDGIEGWAISNFDTVDLESGRLVLDGVGIHTRDEDGEINVGEDAVLATTENGADLAAATVSVLGTLDIGLGGFFAATGDVFFGEDSLFFTRVQDTTAGVVSGNTVTFAEGATIFADVTGNIEASVGEDILIAYAHEENGVTDNGAVVEDNTFLFRFEKVMNGDIIETGSADELFLRVQIEETAFDTADDAEYTPNELAIADALDVYLATQPLTSPLVQWISSFETEEEQREALLKAIKDTVPEESNGSSSATITSTDLIYDMIMDRLSGGGFTVAQNGTTGLAAGDAVLGGDGKWAVWGRAGASRAKFTPGNVNGFDADSWGITAGIDGEVAPNTRVGISGFYIASDVEENGAGANSSNDISGYGVTAYVTYRPGDWYVNGALGYGMNEYESRRRSIGGVNVADYDGNQFVARMEAGKMFTFGQWDVTPNAGLRYNRVDIDAYTETGPLPISVDSQTVESLRAVAGVNLRYSHPLESGGKIVPEFGVKLLGELADPDQALTGNVVGGGAFTTRTTPRDDVSYGVGAGVTWEVSDRFSFRVTYDAELQSDYDEQAVAAALRFAF
jgi:uncharacterized protein with beta-barrel porin domain